MWMEEWKDHYHQATNDERNRDEVMMSSSTTVGVPNLQIVMMMIWVGLLSLSLISTIVFVCANGVSSSKGGRNSTDQDPTVLHASSNCMAGCGAACGA